MGHYFFNNLYGIAYENKLSIRGISDKCGLSPSTLARYVKRAQTEKSSRKSCARSPKRSACRQTRSIPNP